MAAAHPFHPDHYNYQTCIVSNPTYSLVSDYLAHLYQSCTTSEALPKSFHCRLLEAFNMLASRHTIPVQSLLTLYDSTISLYVFGFQQSVIDLQCFVRLYTTLAPQLPSLVERSRYTLSSFEGQRHDLTLPTMTRFPLLLDWFAESIQCTFQALLMPASLEASLSVLHLSTASMANIHSHASMSSLTPPSTEMGTKGTPTFIYDLFRLTSTTIGGILRLCVPLEGSMASLVVSLQSFFVEYLHAADALRFTTSAHIKMPSLIFSCISNALPLLKQSMVQSDDSESLKANIQHLWLSYTSLSQQFISSTGYIDSIAVLTKSGFQLPCRSLSHLIALLCCLPASCIDSMQYYKISGDLKTKDPVPMSDSFEDIHAAGARCSPLESFPIHPPVCISPQDVHASHLFSIQNHHIYSNTAPQVLNLPQLLSSLHHSCILSIFDILTTAIAHGYYVISITDVSSTQMPGITPKQYVLHLNTLVYCMLALFDDRQLPTHQSPHYAAFSHTSLALFYYISKFPISPWSYLWQHQTGQGSPVPGVGVAGRIAQAIPAPPLFDILQLFYKRVVFEEPTLRWVVSLNGLEDLSPFALYDPGFIPFFREYLAKPNTVDPHNHDQSASTPLSQPNQQLQWSWYGQSHSNSIESNQQHGDTTQSPPHEGQRTLTPTTTRTLSLRHCLLLCYLTALRFQHAYDDTNPIPESDDLTSVQLELRQSSRPSSRHGKQQGAEADQLPYRGKDDMSSLGSLYAPMECSDALAVLQPSDTEWRHSPTCDTGEGHHHQLGFSGVIIPDSAGIPRALQNALPPLTIPSANIFPSPYGGLFVVGLESPNSSNKLLTLSAMLDTYNNALQWLLRFVLHPELVFHVSPLPLSNLLPQPSKRSIDGSTMDEDEHQRTDYVSFDWGRTRPNEYFRSHLYHHLQIIRYLACISVMHVTIQSTLLEMLSSGDILVSEGAYALFLKFIHRPNVYNLCGIDVFQVATTSTGGQPQAKSTGQGKQNKKGSKQASQQLEHHGDIIPPQDPPSYPAISLYDWFDTHPISPAAGDPHNNREMDHHHSKRMRVYHSSPRSSVSNQVQGSSKAPHQPLLSQVPSVGAVDTIFSRLTMFSRFDCSVGMSMEMIHPRHETHHPALHQPRYKTPTPPASLMVFTPSCRFLLPPTHLSLVLARLIQAPVSFRSTSLQLLQKAYLPSRHSFQQTIGALTISFIRIFFSITNEVYQEHPLVQHHARRLSTALPLIPWSISDPNVIYAGHHDLYARMFSLLASSSSRQPKSAQLPLLPSFGYIPPPCQDLTYPQQKDNQALFTSTRHYLRSIELHAHLRTISIVAQNHPQWVWESIPFFVTPSPSIPPSASAPTSLSLSPQGRDPQVHCPSVATAASIYDLLPDALSNVSYGHISDPQTATGTAGEAGPVSAASDSFVTNSTTFFELYQHILNNPLPTAGHDHTTHATNNSNEKHNVPPEGLVFVEMPSMTHQKTTRNTQIEIPTPYYVPDAYLYAKYPQAVDHLRNGLEGAHKPYILSYFTNTWRRASPNPNPVEELSAVIKGNPATPLLVPLYVFNPAHLIAILCLFSPLFKMNCDERDTSCALPSSYTKIYHLIGSAIPYEYIRSYCYYSMHGVFNLFHPPSRQPRLYHMQSPTAEGGMQHTPFIASLDVFPTTNRPSDFIGLKPPYLLSTITGSTSLSPCNQHHGAIPCYTMVKFTPSPSTGGVMPALPVGHQMAVSTSIIPIAGSQPCFEIHFVIDLATLSQGDHDLATAGHQYRSIRTSNVRISLGSSFPSALGECHDLMTTQETTTCDLDSPAIIWKRLVRSPHSESARMGEPSPQSPPVSPYESGSVLPIFYEGMVAFQEGDFLNKIMSGRLQLYRSHHALFVPAVMTFDVELTLTGPITNSLNAGYLFHTDHLGVSGLPVSVIEQNQLKTEDLSPSPSVLPTTLQCNIAQPFVFTYPISNLKLRRL